MGKCEKHQTITRRGCPYCEQEKNKKGNEMKEFNDMFDYCCDCEYTREMIKGFIKICNDNRINNSEDVTAPFVNLTIDNIVKQLNNAGTNKVALD
jgi:hypothetical protein